MQTAKKFLIKNTTELLCGVAFLAALLLPISLALFLLAAGAVAITMEHRIVWKQWMTLTAGAIVFALGIGSGTAQAIGWPTFDFATWLQTKMIWSQNISTFEKIVEELKVAKKTYETATSSYQLAQQMADKLRNKQTFSPRRLMQLGESQVESRFGAGEGWNQAADKGVGIGPAYGKATLPLSIGMTFLSGEKLGSSGHLATFARVKIIDDAVQRSLQTTSQIRQQQAANQPSVQTWESSVASADPALNNYAQQQSLTNLGMVQMYEQGRSNLAATSILAQQVAIQNMRDRDAAVRDLNRWEALKEYQSSEPMTPGGMDRAVQNFTF